MSDVQPHPDGTAVVRGEIRLPAFRARHAADAACVTVRYCCLGPASLPVVAVLGGISAHAIVCTLPDGSRGWWDSQVGTDLGIDTRRYRILSFDFITPRRLEGTDCPAIDTRDQADVLAGLLNALGIKQLHAVVGASYGAMVGLQFAARHASRLRQLIAISGAHRAHPQATALRGIQRRIIRAASGSRWHESGLAIARSLAIATYLTPELLAARFDRQPSIDSRGVQFPVDEYLAHNGRKQATHLHADDYLALSESLDLHAVDPGDIRIPVSLVAVESDQLVPLADCRDLNGRLGGPARLHVLHSRHGHDAFLQEHEELRPLLRLALEGGCHD